MLSAKIDGGPAVNASFIPDRRRSRNSPFESPFAPSAVSTFTTNFLLVTVDKCYVGIAHITVKNKDGELVNPTAPRSSYR
jgi:hypothetical protein